MSKKRWTVFITLLVIGLACVVSVLQLGAANPTSTTISPASPPFEWQGTAVGTVSADESTCQEIGPAEEINCDTFTITVTGTPATWAGKRIRVAISWVLLASDYDLYIHKGSNAGPIVDQSAGSANTSETGHIEPSDLNAGGTTVFTAHVVYFAATAGDQYRGVASVVDSGGGPSPTPTPTPPPKSPNWKINYHGTCCEGNLGAAGDNTYVLLPVLVNGNKIKRSTNGGQTWTQIYPPLDVSVPFGIEGDMQAFGQDVIFFGTELATAVVAHSDNGGNSFTVTQDPVISPGNDQAWSYLGPLTGMNPVPLPTDEPYVLAGWFRIGSIVAFSFDGGLTFPIQSPLVGNNGSGPEHVVCHANAQEPPVPAPGDTRVASPLFARQKAGRHGAWGPDRKFYWSETVEGTLYVCQTGDFGANWTGNKHPVALGPGSDFVVTHSAFDNNGTLYVLHGNKLYVSFNQGKTFAFTHTLPRYGDAGRSDSGSDQFFVVDCGTIHIGLLEDAGEGRGRVFYLRGTGVDTTQPIWNQELVDEIDNEVVDGNPNFVRLDFMQIVLDGNGIPTISYTTPDDPGPPVMQRDVTTASRVAGSSSACLAPASVVSRKQHGANPANKFNIPLTLIGNPGIECRQSAVVTDHQIVFTFPVPIISVGGASVSSANGQATADTPIVNGAVVTVNIHNVANDQTVVIKLTNVNNGTTTGSVSVPMGVLLGDVNSSRVVTTADTNLTKGQALKPLTGANFRTDVNTSGNITTADTNLVKGKALTRLD